MFVMWWIMMIAMMLPSAAPIILVHARIDRKSAERIGARANLLPTASFSTGYLLVWAMFSAIATSMQCGFESIGILSPMMNSMSQVFAGAYQLTPLKQACLKHCRGPMSFLMHHWQEGNAGAFQMGAHHGVYCLGCCSGLMAILFFGDIMNLYWTIALALLVLIENVLPVGPAFSYVTGALFTIWRASFLFRAL
jgi:predicted metal-binding membrane protein